MYYFSRNFIKNKLNFLLRHRYTDKVLMIGGFCYKHFTLSFSYKITKNFFSVIIVFKNKITQYKVFQRFFIKLPDFMGFMREKKTNERES